MANDKKFLVKNGLTTQNISFVDDTQTTNNTITVSMLGADTLSFSGNTGQLFSITDSMTGTIFAVNDMSGVPSIEVDDTGTIRLAETFGNVLIGTAVNGAAKFQVAGDTTISGTLTANSIVGSITGNANTATAWQTPRTITVGNTGKSVNGTANVAWSLTEIGAPSISGTGATGTWGISITGNANTTTVLQTSRNISLGGDLSGSASFNGSADITITATIAANSVALGSDTTGNYIATIAGTANEIEVTGSGSETAAVTIGLPDSVILTNDLTVGRNLIVTGNFTVTGNTTIISANNLAIEDNMIYLNEGSVIANPDLGIVGNYNDGAYTHTGVFRDATDNRWKFFKRYDPEPDASIDTAHASFVYGDVQANNFYASAFTGSLVGNASTATTLQASRNINGIPFDGSSDISITSNTTNTLTFNNSGVGAASGSTFNGGTPVTVSHNTIGASPLAGSASLTTTGTITSGTWNGSLVAGQYGGTGVNNTGKTITLGGDLITSGAFVTTLISTATTSITLPTTGTLATLAGSEELSNKTIASGTLTGTLTANGSVGTSGQVLTTTSTGVYWSDVSSGGGGSTNLSYSADTNTVTILSDTGTDAIILAANSTIAGVITADAQTIAGAKTFSSTITGSISGSASSAATLTTPRTIWGQSFNGSLNISGDIASANNITISGGISANGSFGTSGQVLTTNGTRSYWATPAAGGGGGVAKYSTNIGDGSTTIFTITHSLNTADIFVAVRENSSGYFVYPDVQYTSSNTVDIEFNIVPTTNQYYVSVIGA